MEGQFLVVMEGGSPWGFTLQGGVDFRSPLQEGRVSFLISHKLLVLSCLVDKLSLNIMKAHSNRRVITAVKYSLLIICCN